MKGIPVEVPFNEILWAALDDENPKNSQIPAGTYVVLPSSICENPPPDAEGHDPYLLFPDYLLVCQGQSLKREMYPGWSAPYGGGFYDFTLPDLRDKFIIGFNFNDGTPVLGTGCIFYKDVPETDVPPRHQQLLD